MTRRESGELPPFETEHGAEVWPLRWCTLRNGFTIGVVALVDHQHGYFKIYAGLGWGDGSAKDDALKIAEWGSHFGDAEMARVLSKGLPFADLEYVGH